MIQTQAKALLINPTVNYVFQTEFEHFAGQVGSLGAVKSVNFSLKFAGLPTIVAHPQLAALVAVIPL